MNEIIREIYLQRYVLLANLAISLLFCIFLYIFSHRYEWRSDKITFFHFFYSLEPIQLVGISLLLSKLVFTMTNLILGVNIGFGVIFIYLIYDAVTFFLIKMNIKGLLINVIGDFTLFISLLLERYLINYYRDISRENILFILIFVLAIFVTLLSIWQIVQTYEQIIDKKSTK